MKKLLLTSAIVVSAAFAAEATTTKDFIGLSTPSNDSTIGQKFSTNTISAPAEDIRISDAVDAVVEAITPSYTPQATGGFNPVNGKCQSEEAVPGQCYALVSTPPELGYNEREVKVREAQFRTVNVPAQFDVVEEEYIIKEGYTTSRQIPAVFETVTEEYVVKEGFTATRKIPAVYESVNEEVLVSPARTFWKKGTAASREDNNPFYDGADPISCLVEEPAKYKTVTRRVEVEAARTEEYDVEPVYGTRQVRVEVEAARTEEYEVEPVYGTRQVKVEVEPASSFKEQVSPAEYKTVQESFVETPSETVCQPIICRTNATSDVIRGVQQALRDGGYNTGPVDGILGKLTARAVSAYQKDNNLHVGHLTIETIDSLGVAY